MVSRSATVRQWSVRFRSWQSWRPSPFLIEVHPDGAPLTLIEPRHAQGAAGGVTDENRYPDIDRVEPARPPDEEADAQWDQNLRHDRYVERTLGVSGPLESAGIGQRSGDQQPGKAQNPEQLGADLHHCRLLHTEDRQ